MRSEDLFNDIDDKTADRLSKEYPVLNDEQKERLYAMSKRKFDINNENENNCIDVSGVEKYRRPKWYKGASIAAAAVLLVAGIGGSMAFISRNGHGPAADVGESVAVTTEDATEVTTDAEDTVYLSEDVTEAAEETTEADNDVNAIVRELTGAYRDFASDLHAGGLEVDKSSVVTKTFMYPEGMEGQREFYRVTDPRYPTWADIEKRCFEIFDAEFGEVILDNCLCDKEEDINKDTFMYTTDDGYYVETGIIDSNNGTIEWDEYTVNGEFDENGNIIATLRDTRLVETHNFIIESTFTIVNTEDGWRISDVTEKPVEITNEDNNDINAQ
ncbi:MAG: hypothetical protein K5898_15500 [Ruminococcus sp.]|uniref:hypothetical protein n=1 Tax=Ruminococcus sp. TaxID=41978 RepID=UPI0025D4E79B|nr:hypothetical protein [Ruminococcus sp.]MCR4796544.1 hypothetical protein [Ruminococcus sp.]